MYNILLFFQAPTSATTEAAVDGGQESMFELLAHSTFGLIIMVCLLIMSVIAVAIFASRYMSIQKASQIDEGFMNNIRAHVQNGNIGAARALCQSTDSPVARMVEKGLMRIGPFSIRVVC